MPDTRRAGVVSDVMIFASRYLVAMWPVLLLVWNVYECSHLIYECYEDKVKLPTGNVNMKEVNYDARLSNCDHNLRILNGRYYNMPNMQMSSRAYSIFC